MMLPWRRPARYDRKSVERRHLCLAAAAYRYSSEVSLLPHAIVLEVSKSMGLFEPWPRLEPMLRADFTDLGFRHRLVADTYRCTRLTPRIKARLERRPARESR
jgi:hypothetical protein